MTDNEKWRGEFEAWSEKGTKLELGVLCPYRSESEWAGYQAAKRTDAARIAELGGALSKLYEAFLLDHGCFPIDRVDAKTIFINDAMTQAQEALAGQKGNGDG